MSKVTLHPAGVFTCRDGLFFENEGHTSFSVKTQLGKYFSVLVRRQGRIAGLLLLHESIKDAYLSGEGAPTLFELSNTSSGLYRDTLILHTGIPNNMKDKYQYYEDSLSDIPTQSGVLNEPQLGLMMIAAGGPLGCVKTSSDGKVIVFVLKGNVKDENRTFSESSFTCDGRLARAPLSGA